MTVKVLLLDDDNLIQAEWAFRLPAEVQALSAFDIEDAERYVRENPDIALIAVDGCVPGNHLNTLPFVREARQAFRGPMVAVSSNPDFRFELLAAGCDYACEKSALPEKICELLGLPDSADAP